MKKEKVNIHSHIIREDYESKKKKPKPWDTSDKPMLLSELQNNTTLVEKIRTMHNDFLEIEKPELPQIDEVDSEQIESQSDYQLMNSLDISELIQYYQELKINEQELVGKRQRSLVMEQDLRNRLIQEICRKRKVMKELQDEISSLQNSFREIEQELDV
jgi:transcription initiation factor TFIID subunit TAF12